MQQLVSPAEALRLILERAVPLETENLAHAEVLGRILARDVVSPLQLPAFDNSAMDGYALCAADLTDAGESAPASLRVLEIIGAGDVPKHVVSRGQCSKIMTGAPLPMGADAVVMREDTREAAQDEPGDKSTIEVLASARSGENIRCAGSDVAQGEIVLRAGTVVGAAQWAMLASLGLTRIEVFRRPRVALIVTGAELANLDAPLREGQIRDSNSFALRALVENCGAEVALMRACGDDFEAFEAVLREAATQCDAIITSGGVSVGDFDVVRDVLQAVATIIFWKIAMKPGKPVMFADFLGKPVFGLPGNPVSVMVAFEEFARPALLQMSGRRALKRPVVSVQLGGALRSPLGKVEFIRASVRLENGQWHAQFPADQGSGRLSTMTSANALLVIEADCEFVEAGQLVWARLIDCPEID